jgi:predicted translin family RNA/ssDNA-binding protein
MRETIRRTLTKERQWLAEILQERESDMERTRTSLDRAVKDAEELRQAIRELDEALMDGAQVLTDA